MGRGRPHGRWDGGWRPRLLGGTRDPGGGLAVDLIVGDARVKVLGKVRGGRGQPRRRDDPPVAGQPAVPPVLAVLTGPGRSDAGEAVGAAAARLPGWGDQSVRRYGDLALDPRTRLVRRGARGVELSRREFDLLELLVDHARLVLTREVIYDRVWGYGFGTTSNTLNVHVRSLRRKLESGGEPRLIQTVHGVGYVLRD